LQLCTLNYLRSAQSQGEYAKHHMKNGQHKDEHMELVNRIRRHEGHFSLQNRQPKTTHPTKSKTNKRKEKKNREIIELNDFFCAFVVSFCCQSSTGTEVRIQKLEQFPTMCTIIRIFGIFLSCPTLHIFTGMPSGSNTLGYTYIRNGIL
jgi:hypothetical protein